MSESLEKEEFEPCVSNLSLCKTGNPTDFDLSIGKIGSFDTELNLLESTLSKLKDGELENRPTSSNSNQGKELKIEDHSKINKIFNNNNTSDTTPAFKVLKASSKITSCNSCQDTCSNTHNCESLQKYSLSTAQHSKSIYHQGDIDINKFSQNKSENVFSFLDSNSSETNFEVPNNCSREAINRHKPVLIVKCDQTNNPSDKKGCDRPPSLSLTRLEVGLIESDPKCSVSLSIKGEESSKATKYSDEYCDLDTDAIQSSALNVSELEKSDLESFTNSLKPLVSLNRADSCECLLETAETMGDDVSSVDFPHNPDQSNNDLNIVTKPEMDTVCSKVLDSESPESVDHFGSDGNEYQENTTESNEKKYINNFSTPSKLNCDTRLRVESQVSNEDENDEPLKKQGIYFSTPNVTRKLQENLTNQSADTPDFGLVSPLDGKCLKGKQNLKRKYIGLQPIEEIEEDIDIITEKKIKVVDETDTVHSVLPVEAGTSSTLHCFEAPAKSLLKKWQPSCLSRNVSATSFIVLDECGETEFEDCLKASQECDSSRADDFEIACQSLTEELMKSSSNIETLEKYHSQVQLENQMDDEKFDEILKELTMNVDMDDKTCLSIKSMEESTLVDTDQTSHVLQTMEEPVGALQPSTENEGESDIAISLPENNTTITEVTNQHAVNEIDDMSIGDKITDSTKLENIAEVHKSSNEKAASESVPHKEKLSKSDEEIPDIDEEDVLLEENINPKDKPYEFFEFVSTDPKENEDNYNPEWQKLGRLTSDEERYRAVRDRWRSLVPPDPNRNLTYRQWRARNNKSPIKMSPLNNNHQLMDDNERNQLCTAVFDNKIRKIVQELEDSRMNIYRQRNRDFEELGHVQDNEQMRASMSGLNYREMAQLHSNHLNQCRAVKNQYDQELKRIQDITEAKIRILREASEEVLMFQKFYKGVGARDDNEIYLTDIQVQELMETEEMLEQYHRFYK